MGIAGLYGWLTEHYREHILRLALGQTLGNNNIHVDILMIDMNGLFHTSAQKVYEYGNHKPSARVLRAKKQHRPPQGYKAQLRVFEDVCQTVETLFRLVDPKKRLILCVDGPAPLSKQNQQRQRRFRSAMEASSEAIFDSNAITPGTKFMDFLTKYIDWYIRKRVSEDPAWQRIQVLFSNEKAPGEGEHKIINYIRYYGNPKDTYCLHGLDADLIMLALGTHLPNFYILREDMYDPSNEYFCVNIGTIRQEMAETLRWEEKVFRYDPRSAVNDFIFLCFMVGNDFLPHIPSIEIIERGIQLIIEVYKEVGTHYGHVTRTVSGSVQFRPRTLGIFLGTIGQHEKSNFEAKLAKKKSYFPDPLLEMCSTQNENGTWNVDIEKYHSDYFNASFPEGTDEKKLCHEYFEGMQWVLSYYTRGVPNWKWNFKYHYSPCASILAKHAESFVFPTYPRTIPSTPYQQLLCVLPPKSANLIPEPLCQLLTSDDSPLHEYCPQDFDIDLSGKRREWQGIVILPMVDFDLVRECYLERLDKVDPRDLKRNKLGRSFVYEYKPNLQTTFRSHYGDIERCLVKATGVDL